MSNEITADTWRKFGYKPPVEKPLPPAQFMPHVDCFSFREGYGCGALKKTYCCYGVCRFYKRKEEKDGT